MGGLNPTILCMLRLSLRSRALPAYRMTFLALACLTIMACSSPENPAPNCDCSNLACGDNACGESCGQCPVANACESGTCVPNPCAGTDSCRIFGKCTPIQGVCMAGSDDDCAQSESCTEDGECLSERPLYDKDAESHTEHLACWQPAGEDGECAEQCRAGGRCHAAQGLCAARSDADCEQSEACAEWGACTYGDGECWRGGQTPEDCRVPFGPNGEHGCNLFGFCTPTDGLCQAGSDADCQGAFVCLEWEECKALDGECWQPATF